ncbi:unnamed protein product [Rhizoctonia solani]|uniref:Uncharacterized protein n=1 Tax=Rhizoctonia solani TaxID=456999 RepID=A0A8H3CS03_9AGAM|nr:unnamed protein product [Rhizoctonia solani]
MDTATVFPFIYECLVFEGERHPVYRTQLHLPSSYYSIILRLIYCMVRVSIAPLLLTVTVAGIAIWAMVNDPLVMITCFLQLAILPYEHTPYLAATKTLHNYYVLERCPDNTRAFQLNCCLYVVMVLCVISAAVVIIIAPSLLSRLSVSQSSLGGRRTNTKSSRSYHNIHAASLKDGLQPEGLATGGASATNVFEQVTNLSTEEYIPGSSLNVTQVQANPALDGATIRIYSATQRTQRSSGGKTVIEDSIYSRDSTAIAPNSQRGLSYPVQQTSPGINGTRLEYSETTLGSLFILVIAVGEDIECLKFLWLTPGVSEPGRINFHSLD